MATPHAEPTGMIEVPEDWNAYAAELAAKNMDTPLDDVEAEQRLEEVEELGETALEATGVDDPADDEDIDNMKVYRVLPRTSGLVPDQPVRSAVEPHYEAEDEMTRMVSADERRRMREGVADLPASSTQTAEQQDNGFSLLPADVQAEVAHFTAVSRGQYEAHRDGDLQTSKELSQRRYELARDLSPTAKKFLGYPED